MIKRKTLLGLSAFFMLLNAPNAFAYKLVLFTDDQNYEVGLAAIKEIRNTYPFNKFDIKFQIARAKPEDLDCSAIGTIDRLVTCQNADKINSMTKKLNGDQALVVKNIPMHGGSSGVGSGIPVITSGTPPRALVHEYLHTLGLCDEYIYSKVEADRFCNTARVELNITYIAPEPSYENDLEARSKHSKDINWYGDINSKTPITNSNGKALGTSLTAPTRLAAVNNTSNSVALEEPMGLYPSNRCLNSTNNIKAWKPSATVTIMQNMTAGLSAPLEAMVERVLLSRGAKYKTAYEPIMPESSDEEKSPRTPTSAVNDSPRSFLGNIKGYAQEFYQKVKRSISR